MATVVNWVGDLCPEILFECTLKGSILNLVHVSELFKTFLG